MQIHELDANTRMKITRMNTMQIHELDANTRMKITRMNSMQIHELDANTRMKIRAIWFTQQFYINIRDQICAYKYNYSYVQVIRLKNYN